MRLDRLRPVSVTGCGGRRALGTSEIKVVIADESDVIRIARGGRGAGPLFNLSGLRPDVRMDHRCISRRCWRPGPRVLSVDISAGGGAGGIEKLPDCRRASSS